MKKIALASVALAALVVPAAAGIKSAGGSSNALPPGSQPVDAAGKDNKGGKGKKVGKTADPCAVAGGGALVKAKVGGGTAGVANPNAPPGVGPIDGQQKGKGDTAGTGVANPDAPPGVGPIAGEKKGKDAAAGAGVANPDASGSGIGPIDGEKKGKGRTAGAAAANPNTPGGGSSGIGPIAGLTKPSDPCATPRASKQAGKPAQKPLPDAKPKRELAAKQGKSCPPGMQPNRSGTGCLPSLDGGGDFSVGSGLRASGGGVGGTAASPGGGCRKC